MIEYNIKKILVPVDFSPASMNALDTAIAMAKQQDAAILLMNVVEPGGLSGIQGEYSNNEESVLAMTHHSEQELQVLQHSIIEKYMIPCEVIAATGIVSSSIIKISAGRKADLIVMGAHGSSGFKESTIGINAFNVVKTADCPVLTIPSQKKWGTFKKILFPVRPVLAALEKYDFIRKIIRKNDGTLKILGLATDDEQDINLVKDMALQLNEKLRADEIAASTYFKVGKNMAEEVIKIAALIETDLIVITAGIDSLLKQVFVGPYTRQILNQAHFPVLSIKPYSVNELTAVAIRDFRKPSPGGMPLYT
ncbi:MAG: universal stress protein [Ferruginibacter sp.]|nr:universal stress protein [Ferruginibacter sp.]